MDSPGDVSIRTRGENSSGVRLIGAMRSHEEERLRPDTTCPSRISQGRLRPVSRSGGVVVADAKSRPIYLLGSASARSVCPSALHCAIAEVPP
jgi:hypothetical protein